MIQINNTELRNLEEQVLFNSNRIDSIIEGNEVLAEMGIKVVGQASSTTGLPNAETYTGNFGDAYLVGTQAPYSYYIYTRPFAGEELPKWFNLGQFPVPGPQGPQGVRGPIGLMGQSGKWYTTDSVPNFTGYEGDMAIVLTAPNNANNGNILKWSDEEGDWLLVGNIRGPQGVKGANGAQGPIGPIGPQGPVGPAGPQGQFITIKGTLTNIDQLPDPTTVGRESAYIIPINDVNHIFVITGEDTLLWTDAGSFSGGSRVTVNGAFVQSFDADTKLNTLSGGVTGVYVRENGIDTGKYYSQGAGPNWMVQRTNEGQIALPDQTTTIPTDDQAISKKYADDAYTKRGSTVPIYDNSGSGLTRIYGCGPYAKGAGMFIAAPQYASVGASIVMRSATTGSFYVPIPTEAEHPANKQYVDSKITSTHEVTSLHEISQSGDADIIAQLESNCHLKIYCPNGGTITTDDGTQVNSIMGTIPSFETAEVCYGDTGYGYVTCNNSTTYVFNVDAGYNDLYIYSSDAYIIKHI